MSDWAETELGFECLAECQQAPLQFQGDVPGGWCPFRPDINLWVGERYEILTASEDAPYVEVPLKTLHAFIYVKREAERGGAEVFPVAQKCL